MRATAACVAGGPRSVQALIEALRSGPTELKKEAAAMLARIKDPQAGVALVGLLEHDEEVVRKAGAAALEQMAGVLDQDTARVLVALLPTTPGTHDQTGPEPPDRGDSHIRPPPLRHAEASGSGCANRGSPDARSIIGSPFP